MKLYNFFSLVLIVFLFAVALMGCGNTWFGDDVVGPEDGSKKTPATGTGGPGNPKPIDKDGCDTCDSTYTIPEEPVYDLPDNADGDQPVDNNPDDPKDLPADVRNIQLFIEPVTIAGTNEVEFRLSAFGGMGLDEIVIGVKKDAKTNQFVIGEGISFDPAGGFQMSSISVGEGGKAVEYRQDGGMLYLRIKVNPVLNQVWKIADVRGKVLKTKCFEGGVDPGEFLLIAWPSVDSIQLISDTFNIVPNKIENGWVRIKK